MNWFFLSEFTYCSEVYFGLLQMRVKILSNVGGIIFHGLLTSPYIGLHGLIKVKHKWSINCGLVEHHCGVVELWGIIKGQVHIRGCIYLWSCGVIDWIIMG